MNASLGVVERGSPDIELCSRYVAYIDVAVRAGDVVIIVLSALAAAMLRFNSVGAPPRYHTVTAVAVLLAIIVFPVCGVYRSWRGERLATELVKVWLAWSVVLLATLVIGWAFKATEDYSRLWVGAWFSGAAILFALHRSAGRMSLRLVRSRGIDTRRVVLVGATDAGRKIVQATRANPWMGLHVVGYIATPHDRVTIDGLPQLGELDRFTTHPGLVDCDQVWITLPMQAEADIRRLQQALDDSAVTVRFVPDLFGYELLNQRASQLAGIPIITLRGSRITGYSRFIKSAEDRVLSALILIALSPLMVLLAIGVKLSSPGPILFKQRRLGLGGRSVEVWKFRSMRVHSEADGVVTQCAREDPRTTRFGRFIRRTSLDELPQFINVLRGTMSIVGPRPHAIEHDHYYRRLIKGYAQRHQVKPGITGWAQVHGLRGETNTLEKMAKRVQYDMVYIRTWSLLLDLRIIAKTAAIAFFPGKNAY